uniref:RNA-directed DNA polymerase, eukaryota n=1 Tax=Tanacetum cinerariifolium TaxID=118510 RepID=A0A699H5X0_TANCI|nr:RNA-directed DNA polymerase, eukaryota [Tanacetum cinerariifolium]
MLELILHQQQSRQLLKQKKLLQTQEDQSNIVQALNVDALKVDLVMIQNTCYGKENNISETALSKSVKESNSDFETKDVHAIRYKIQMSDKYFAEYTRIKVKQFRETLLQHMSYVKKFVAERTRHERQYDIKGNKRQMQTQEKMPDESSRSGNDTDTNDANIKPIYDEEPMAEIQLIDKCNIFSTRQHHNEQPEIINEDVNGMEKVEDSIDENSLADLNNLKETINELATNEIQHPITKGNIDKEDEIKKVSPEIVVSSNLSQAPGFEHTKITSSKCSTSIARYRKKDIKGVSLIKELSRIIEVGDSLGFDVRSMDRGRSRGRISMWDLNSLIKDDIWCDDAFIIEKGHWRNTVGDCYMINIYGPRDSLAKAILWNGIGDFMHQQIARIKQWHSETKTSDRVTKHDKLKLIKYIERKIKTGYANDDDCDSRIKLLQGVDRLDTFESFDLFQKARVKWDIKGDENFKFFQALIKKKKRDQMIYGIMKEDEVKNAVWDCAFSKAPGPNGFSFTFVKKYRDYIKVDILEYVNISLDIGLLPHGSNSSFFTLISKISNPILIKDFCPISLIGVHYKIIDKILANRLAKVIDKIVSQKQSAFIVGHHILNGPLILS